MFTNRQKLTAPASAPENISILLVSAHGEDITCLRNILHHRDWHIQSSASAAEASRLIVTHNPCVIVCERDLPDGNWKDILHQTEGMEHAPLLLVVSRHADENLWAEVLNLGGYDVLLKPFDRAEVARVVGMAWRYWMSNVRQMPVPAQPAPQFA